MKNLAKISFVVLVVAGVGSARADDASNLKLAEQVYDVEHGEYGYILGVKLGLKKVNENMIPAAIERAEKEGRSHADFDYLLKCKSTKAYDNYLENYAKSILPLDKMRVESAKIYAEEFTEQQLSQMIETFPSDAQWKILHSETLDSDNQQKFDAYKNSDIGKLEASKSSEMFEKVKTRVLPIQLDAQKENMAALDAGKPPTNAKEIENLNLKLNQECAKELGIAPMKPTQQPVTSN